MINQIENTIDNALYNLDNVLSIYKNIFQKIVKLFGNIKNLLYLCSVNNQIYVKL
jgi:hypothetical protein